MRTPSPPGRGSGRGLGVASYRPSSPALLAEGEGRSSTAFRRSDRRQTRQQTLQHTLGIFSWQLLNFWQTRVRRTGRTLLLETRAGHLRIVKAAQKLVAVQAFSLTQVDRYRGDLR